jgi:hypothetical protein
MDRLPTDRRDKIEARAAALIAEEMSLRDLRRAMGQTRSPSPKNSASIRKTSAASNSAPTSCSQP